jgi:hypothetical protein
MPETISARKQVLFASWAGSDRCVAPNSHLRTFSPWDYSF